MNTELFTLYKLMILYMLDRVNFPITNAQISGFLVEKDYTDFLTLQRALNELTETGMMNAQTIRNRTHLAITNEGRETLRYFENRINEAIRKEIENYLKENGHTLRNEVSVLASYTQNTNGEYDARLIAQDRGVSLIDLTLTVPTKKIAENVCDNWQKKNQEIYQYITRELF